MPITWQGDKGDQRQVQGLGGETDSPLSCWESTAEKGGCNTETRLDTVKGFGSMVLWWKVRKFKGQLTGILFHLLLGLFIKGNGSYQQLMPKSPLKAKLDLLGKNKGGFHSYWSCWWFEWEVDFLWGERQAEESVNRLDSQRCAWVLQRWVSPSGYNELFVSTDFAYTGSTNHRSIWLNLRIKRVSCIHCTIQHVELLWILVSAGVPGTNPPRILRDDHAGFK